MSNKITIIGAGSVGATIAYTLTLRNLASEIVLIDLNTNKALGEAMDIRQGTPFCSPTTIYAGDYRDAEGSDIVILTSGVARKPGQSRLDLAQINVNITKSIIPQIVAHAPNAIYIIVSNPVDVLTYEFCKLSGLPEKHIIGSGTILDTARLRARLAENFAISMKNVHAAVYGEHGDSSFVPWSTASISSIPVEQYRDAVKGQNALMPELNKTEVEQYMRKSGAKVIARKGATFYAVAIAVAHICQCISDGIDTALTVSTMMHGEYGIEDVCLSTLTIVGKDGVSGKILSPLTAEETALLHHSADNLRGVLNQLDLTAKE